MEVDTMASMGNPADDLAERLRSTACRCGEFEGTCAACAAAAEIERLRTLLETAMGDLVQLDAAVGDFLMAQDEGEAAEQDRQLAIDNMKRLLGWKDLRHG
jgi:hypothetical protein